MFAEERDIEATPRAKSPVPRVQDLNFRSLLYIDFICSEVKPIVCLSVLRLNSSHQVHVPEVGSTRRSKSPMRRAALEEDSSQIFPSPVFDRLSVSNKHSNGH